MINTRPIATIRKILIPLIVLFLIPGLFPKAQPKSEIPFLYYYSTEQSAFIVERADGSNSRILANFSLTEQIPNQEAQSIISGPGWSPSGNWFVWRETTNYGGSSAAYVVSRDGKTHDVLLNGLHVAVMEWSPTNDVLMVMDQANDVYIVNMQASQSANQFIVQIGGRTEWTPDGSYLVSYVITNDKIAKMDLFTEHGLQESREYYQNNQACTYPRWSRNGLVAYQDTKQEQVIIEDFVSWTLNMDD